MFKRHSFQINRSLAAPSVKGITSSPACSNKKRKCILRTSSSLIAFILAGGSAHAACVPPVVDQACFGPLTWTSGTLDITSGGSVSTSLGPTAGDAITASPSSGTTLGQFTNSGSVSASSTNHSGINFTGPGTRILNQQNGVITGDFAGIKTSGTSGPGIIENYGTIGTSGSIISDYGIYNTLSGGLGNIYNFGTINGSGSGSGPQYDIYETIGTVQQIRNSQGARLGQISDPLTHYTGNTFRSLNYFAQINSLTDYGQYKPTIVNAAIPVFFFPLSDSVLVDQATYQNVLIDVPSSNLQNKSGAFTAAGNVRYNWTLIETFSGSGIWNLFVALANVNISNLSVTVSQNTNTTRTENTAANLSGTVTVNVTNGAAAYLPNRKMTIVSSTGLSGTFSGVTTSQNLSFLTPYLSYDANNVYLSYGLTPFSTVAKNINQRNVGNALTIGALGAVNSLNAPILNALFYGDYQNAQAVMDTVGGSGLAGVQSTAMQVGEMASSSVSDQIAFWRSGETMDATGRTSQEGNNPRNFLAYAPTETKVAKKGPINLKGPAGSLTAAYAPRTFRAWGSMFGGGANYLSDAGRGAAASNIGYYGGLIGVDYQVQPNILVGVALGGSSSNFNVGSLSTNGNLTGFHAGVYGAYTMGNSYIALNETFSAYSNQTTRKAGGYALMPYEQLSASFGSTEFRTRAEVGHGVLMGGLKATPFIAAEIAAYQSNAFSEQSSIYASTFALKNNGQGVNSLPTFAGLRLSNAVTLSNGWRLAPVGSVAYVHEFYPQRQFNNILMSIPGADFNVAGPRSTYNLVQTKVGAQLNLNEKLALFTDFQGEFSPVSQSYGGKGGIKYVW